ncbi:MAG: hypothetical protein R2788_21255 [Saprospiraceae bacterium]
MRNKYPIYTTVEMNPETVLKELDEEAFDYPFFNTGVTATIEKTFYQGSPPLNQGFEEGEELELKGLIFSVSHCGSTLLVRMLNQLQGVKIVSESEAINGLLLSKILYNLDDHEIVNRLKGVISLYQQKANAKHSLIIKLTSWNVYLIRLFHQAFPNLKWIFIDRETEELTNSIMSKDGGFIEWWDHSVDHLRKHFIETGITINNKEDYIRQMIKGHRSHANDHKNSRGLFLNYPQFIEDYEEIINHFGLAVTEEEIANSKKMLEYDSKSMEKKNWTNKSEIPITAALKSGEPHLHSPHSWVG